MAKSNETPVSPIADPAHGKSPREALTGFLKYTVDTPDFERAKAFLSKRSASAGNIHTSALPAGATYTLGAEETDELGKRFSVKVRGAKSPASAAAEEMTVPMVVVEEEGEWRIDLPATMERMMGGVVSAVEQAVGAMGQLMTGAMEKVDVVLSESLGAAAGAAQPARATEAASAPRKKPPAKKAKKSPAKPARQAGKVRPAATKKAAAPKRVVRKAKPAKKSVKPRPAAKKRVGKPAKKRRR